MKKYPLLFVIFLYIFFTIGSCGVILDTAKISGIWYLDYVEFYSYSAALDSYKKYFSIRIEEDNPSDINPVKGEFFSEKTMKNFIIEFSESVDRNNFTVTCIDDNTTDILINSGEWVMNTFESSISLIVRPNTTSNGIWAKGFTSKNYWPLAELNRLEIVLKKEDVGNITVSLSDKDIDIVYMKGIFSKKKAITL